MGFGSSWGLGVGGWGWMFDELLLAQFLSHSFARTCVRLRFLSCIILPWSNRQPIELPTLFDTGFQYSQGICLFLLHRNSYVNL